MTPNKKYSNISRQVQDTFTAGGPGVSYVYHNDNTYMVLNSNPFKYPTLLLNFNTPEKKTDACYDPRTYFPYLQYSKI